MQDWLDREHQPLSPNPAKTTTAPIDDEPAALITKQAAKLVEGFAPVTIIADLDPLYYKSYLRPRLRIFPDQDAAKLMTELDRRCGLV